MSREAQSSARLTLLIAGLLSFLLLGAGQAVMGPALPVFQDRFGIDTATAGGLISSLGVGSFSGLVGMYFLGRHVTPRLALTVMAAGAGLLALAPGFWVSVAGGAVFGCGFGSVAALFNGRIFVAFGPRGASMVSLLNAGYSVGAIAAPLLFVALGSDPRLLYGIIAVVTALTVLISGKAGAVRTTTPTAASRFRFDFPILAFGAVAVGIEVSLAGLGPSAMIRAGIPAEGAARLLSVFFMAFLAGRLVLTVMAHRVPPFTIYIAGCLFTSVCAFGCVVFGPLWWFAPMGLSAGLLFPGYFVTATARMGDDPRVAPVILATTQIGAVFGPLIVAQAMPGLEDRGFFWLIAIAAAVISGLGLVLYRWMSKF